MIQATTPALSSTTSLRCNCRWLNRPLMENSQDTFLACSLEFPAWCHHDRQLHLHVHRQVIISVIILKTIFIISISASLSQQATTVTWEPSVAGTQSQVMLRTRQNEISIGQVLVMSLCTNLPGEVNSCHLSATASDELLLWKALWYFKMVQE